MELFDFSFNAMGSPCTMQFFAGSRQQAIESFNLVITTIGQLERRYSRYRNDSLLSEINSRAGSGVKTYIDNEAVALLGYADQCYRQSSGLFDVTSGVLRRVWGERTLSMCPSQAEIAELLPLIGWKKVQWDSRSVYLPRGGMELDFGGIVKEYAADAAATILRQAGHVSGIVELGGDVRVIGPLPNGDGWPIRVMTLQDLSSGSVSIRLKHGAIASSGDYERFQLIDGVRYSHILNPKTGWPVSGLRAVSVIADHCVVAGSVATIAMLNANNGRRWLENTGLAYLCCQNDGRIFNRLKGY